MSRQSSSIRFGLRPDVGIRVGRIAGRYVVILVGRRRSTISANLRLRLRHDSPSSTSSMIRSSGPPPAVRRTSRRSTGRAADHGLTPFDQGDAVLQLLFDAELMDLLEALQPVDVDVAEADAALVLAHQGEGRADHRAVDLEAAAHTLGEAPSCRRRAAGEDDHVAGPQHVAPQLLAQGPGLLDGTADDLHGIHSPRAAAPGTGRKGEQRGLRWLFEGPKRATEGRGMLPHARSVAFGRFTCLPLGTSAPSPASPWNTAARTAAATASAAATRRRSGWASTSPVARTTAKSPS